MTDKNFYLNQAKDPFHSSSGNAKWGAQKSIPATDIISQLFSKSYSSETAPVTEKKKATPSVKALAAATAAEVNQLLAQEMAIDPDLLADLGLGAYQLIEILMAAFPNITYGYGAQLSPKSARALLKAFGAINPENDALVAMQRLAIGNLIVWRQGENFTYRGGEVNQEMVTYASHTEASKKLIAAFRDRLKTHRAEVRRAAAAAKKAAKLATEAEVTAKLIGDANLMERIGALTFSQQLILFYLYGRKAPSAKAMTARLQSVSGHQALAMAKKSYPDNLTLRTKADEIMAMPAPEFSKAFKALLAEGWIERDQFSFEQITAGAYDSSWFYEPKARYVYYRLNSKLRTMMNTDPAVKAHYASQWRDLFKGH